MENIVKKHFERPKKYQLCYLENDDRGVGNQSGGRRGGGGGAKNGIG